MQWALGKTPREMWAKMGLTCNPFQFQFQYRNPYQKGMDTW